MRLTLRTLLAYLDDLLGPTETREIGTKVAESPIATDLIERIRKVVKQRRLTFPGDAEGGFGDRFIDPNLVAEYLDNVLPLEVVEKTERRILDDDVRLAETAASHQILGLVLGEPIEIPDGVRARARATLSLPEATAASASPLPPPATRTSTNEFEIPTPAGPSEAFSETPPAASVSWKRFVPYAALGAVAVAWFALIWFDPGVGGFLAVPIAKEGFEGQAEPAVADPAVDEPTVDVAGQEPEGAVDPAVTDEAGGAAVVEGLEPPPFVAPPEPPAVVPAEDITADPATAVAAVDRPIGVPLASDASQAEAVAAVTPEDVPAETPAADPPPPEPATIDALPTDAGAFLLQHRPASFGWIPTAAGRPVSPVTEFAVPEPFSGQFVAADAARPVVTAVAGGTRVDWLPGSVPTYRLVRGRIVLSGGVDSATLATLSESPLAPALPADAPAGPTTVAFAVADGVVEVTLAGPETRLAAERVWPDLTVRNGTVPLLLFAADGGEVAVVDAAGSARALADGETAALDPAGRFATPGMGGPLAEAAVAEIGEWIDAVASVPASPASASELSAGVTAETPAEIGLPPLVEDRRAFLSTWALRALGVIGAVDPLVRALDAAPRDGVVAEAAAELRLTVATAEDGADRLREALAARFPAEEAALVDALLVDLTAAALSDVQTEMILEALASDRELVRELALEQFVARTGRRFNYRADAGLTRRQSSIRRMREYAARVGGLLPEAAEEEAP